VPKNSLKERDMNSAWRTIQFKRFKSKVQLKVINKSVHISMVKQLPLLIPMGRWPSLLIH